MNASKELDDPLFGKLTWFEPLESWQGAFRAPSGEIVEFGLDPLGDAEHLGQHPSLVSFTDEARSAFVATTRGVSDIKIFTAERLLEEDLEWGDHDAPSVEELVQHLIPCYLRVDADGYADIRFHDSTSQIYGLVSVTCRIWPDGSRVVSIDS